MSEPTNQICYHCNQECDAEAYGSIGDTWICPDCGEKLVEAGAIEDEHQIDEVDDPLKLGQMVTDPFMYFRRLEVTSTTVWIAMLGYFFFYLSNGLQRYDFEMELTSYLKLITLAGISLGSWGSFIIYGGFLHLAARIVGGTGHFTRTATALGHAVLLPTFLGVLLGILWVYPGLIDPRIIYGGFIVCSMLIVAASILAMRVVNELSWWRSILAWLLLPLTTMALAFAMVMISMRF